MEKAHGWTYVRSKNNGKIGKKGSTTSSVPPTPSVPQTPNMETPVSSMTDHLPTPMTGPAPSPFEPVLGFPSNPPFNFADPPSTTNEDFQLFPDNSPYGDQPPSLDDFSPFSSTDFEAFRAQLEAAPRNELLAATDIHRPSFDSTATATDSMGAPGLFDDSPLTSTDSSLNFDIDWSNIPSGNMDDEYTAMDMQLLTPDGSVEPYAMNSLSKNSSICNPSPLLAQACKISSLSPGGQGNLMLYSPSLNNVEGGFTDLYDYGWSEKPFNDFTLYENPGNAGGNMPGITRASELPTTQESNPMFPPLNTGNNDRLGNHSWAGQGFGSSNLNGMMDLDDYLG